MAPERRRVGRRLAGRLGAAVAPRRVPAARGPLGQRLHPHQRCRRARPPRDAALAVGRPRDSPPRSLPLSRASRGRRVAPRGVSPSLVEGEPRAASAPSTVSPRSLPPDGRAAAMIDGYRVINFSCTANSQPCISPEASASARAAARPRRVEPRRRTIEISAPEPSRGITALSSIRATTIVVVHSRSLLKSRHKGVTSDLASTRADRTMGTCHAHRFAIRTRHAHEPISRWSPYPSRDPGPPSRLAIVRPTHV